MTPDLHATHVLCDEGAAFAARHRADLSPPAQSLGALAWGLLRAVAECPVCPGVFRVPSDRAWTHLDCPQCHGRWTFQGQEDAP